MKKLLILCPIKLLRHGVHSLFSGKSENSCCLRPNLLRLFGLAGVSRFFTRTRFGPNILFVAVRAKFSFLIGTFKFVMPLLTAVPTMRLAVLFYLHFTSWFFCISISLSLLYAPCLLIKVLKSLEKFRNVSPSVCFLAMIVFSKIRNSCGDK